MPFFGQKVKGQGHAVKIMLQVQWAQSSRRTEGSLNKFKVSIGNINLEDYLVMQYD